LGIKEIMGIHAKENPVSDKAMGNLVK